MNDSDMIRRLDRIEQKVDQFGAALISFAKTEEKVANLYASTVSLSDRLMKVSDDVADLDKERAERNAVSRRVERAIWGIGSLLGVIVTGVAVAVLS